MADFEGVLMALAVLTALQVKHAETGTLYDGGGVRNRVYEESVRAVLRYTSPGGERGELGLGAMDRTSTQAAGRGDRAGQWSIRINDQWRVCFKFVKGDAVDVEVCDYH